MKKTERKENANKGFSLVELIVVVAIMAVLIGILAPQYLKYVEKTRTQKDETAGEEFRHAVEIAIADETIYNSLGLSASAATKTVTAPDNAAFTGGSSDLLTELNSVLDAPIDYTSSAHNTQSYVVTITYDDTTKTVDVEGVFQATP